MPTASHFYHGTPPHSADAQLVVAPKLKRPTQFAKDTEQMVWNRKLRRFFQNQPVNRLLIAAFAAVAVVPMVILAAELYHAAWNNAWREIHEKHQLLAENLAAPVSIYVEDNRAMLGIYASLLEDATGANPKSEVATVLQHGLAHMSGFRSLVVLSPDKKVIHYLGDSAAKWNTSRADRFQKLDFVNAAYAQDETIVSPVMHHPLTNEPAIFLARRFNIHRAEGSCILIGELRIDTLEKLRKGIRFGEKGHSAMVDAAGKVIAHPNPAWMTEVRDMSKLNVVKSMMAGETGVTEFYSPFIKSHMVAGYTSVPGLGWGIMVPQPKVEVERQVRTILLSHLVWGAVGLLLAIVTALLLTRWITQPIDSLASAARAFFENNFQRLLVNDYRAAPREIGQLTTAFWKVVDHLIRSKAEIQSLNETLQSRVDAATEELREANTKLAEMVQRDHLTSLANRRYFEDAFQSRKRDPAQNGTDVCLLLVDVDNFKEVNDQFGHAAGDMVLVEIAAVLRQNMRQNDVAARYAGDEFIAIVNAPFEAGKKRCTQFREQIERHTFMIDGQSIKVTVSVGLLYCDIAACEATVEQLVKRVDKALYAAKRSGRNKIAVIAA